MKILSPGMSPFDLYPVRRPDRPPSATSPEAQALTQTKAVNQERDRRIAGGFSFQGQRFQTDPDSVKRVAGAASAAHVAITLNAAQAGDLRWADAASDFVWIATDNSLVAMDAPTVIAFAQAYMAHERALIFAAKTIKDRLHAGDSLDVRQAAEWP